jgi:hypothetical protein
LVGALDFGRRRRGRSPNMQSKFSKAIHFKAFVLLV